jgi:hypothetical protein
VDGEEIKLVDNIVSIMKDVLATDSPTVRVNGEKKPRELIKSALLKLRFEDIEIALAKLAGVNIPIKRTKDYVTTLLYNQAIEGDVHLENYANTYRMRG